MLRRITEGCGTHCISVGKARPSAIVRALSINGARAVGSRVSVASDMGLLVNTDLALLKRLERADGMGSDAVR